MNIKTKLNKIILILGLQLLCINYVKGQHLEWVALMNGHSSGISTTRGNCTDRWGNIYTTGQHAFAKDLDPGPAVLTQGGALVNMFIQKLDPSGNLIWAKGVGDMTGASEAGGRSVVTDSLGNVYITGWFISAADFDPGPNVFNVTGGGYPDSTAFILKLDINGDFVWVKSMGSSVANESVVAHSIGIDAQRNTYIKGKYNGTVDFDPGAGVFNLTGGGGFLQKLDENGNFIWAISCASEGNIIVDALGNIYLDAKKYDTNGNLLFDLGVYGYFVDVDAFGNSYRARDTSFSFTWGDYSIVIEKRNSNNVLEWRKSVLGDDNSTKFVSVKGIKADNQGNVYVSGWFFDTIDFDPGSNVFNLITNDIAFWSGGMAYPAANVFLLKLNINGDFEWVVNIPTGYTLINVLYDYYNPVTVDNFGNVYVGGTMGGGRYISSVLDTIMASASEESLFVLKVAQNGISGKVVLDNNANCVVDSLEIGKGGVILQFVNGTDTFYSTTNSQGRYSCSMSLGTYTVSVLNSGVYTQGCPTSQQVSVSVGQYISNIDWALEPVINCPLLNVDIAAPYLRAYGGTYTVFYSNHGTVDALNAFVDVEIDPYLNVVGSSIPIASQNGNVYTFNVGNVGVEQYGSFTISVFVDTSAIYGQTHCTEAHIYPDSVCIPSYWNGAIIDVEGVCQNDTVFFKLQNTGASPLSSKTYYVFEDHIIMRIGNTGTINPNDSIIVSIAANVGRSYRITVDQEPGFPPMLGDAVATAAVEGCVPDSNGNFNTGFITQFSNGNSSPFIAVDCQQNIGSFDPNDKAAQPEGYDAIHHYIYDYTALDYRIRFQNTGTDTAFHIVVRDTISPYLDLATLEMGASSHSYIWRVYQDRILEVTFRNIMLPDSNVNEPLSHGFFRYRIEQEDNNPLGAVIYNGAGIYFDFNDPILTNQTWHTVGENFETINLSVEHIFEPTVDVLVYPNPFTHQATIEVKGKDYQELNLTIYDLTGRVIMQERSYTNNMLQLSKGNLQIGMYIYQLEGDGQLINTGKIVVQ